jgi:phytoene dehydrogenase-like protein
MSRRALIIGAGVDELVCAHLLARGGRQVTVLAGPADPDHPDAGRGWIPPRVIRELALESHGLTIDRPDPWVTAPLPDGGVLPLYRDEARSVAAIRRVSPHDAMQWPAFCGRMARFARLLARLYTAPPPDPLTRELGEIARLGGFGLRLRGLGRQPLADFLRLVPMPVADWLDDWFESDELKGLLGAAGVRDLHQGPRAGGTAFRLLHQHVGSPPGVFRPPRSNVRDVLAALPGIEVRDAVDVAQISVEAGRVAGVVLASGEALAAPIVTSGADPGRTLLGLVDPGWLDPELVHALRHARRRGIAARVTLALERAQDAATWVVAPSLDYLERAHDDAKYGRVSQQPWIEASLPRTSAAGRQIVDAHVQYVPGALADGDWNDASRKTLGVLTRQLLARTVPALETATVERVRTPHDLEADYGWPQGQPHHLELTLDQALWMRPVPGLARYRTPVAGLYLCGPGTHPGGGIPGAAGYNAARAILRDARRGRLA